MKSLAGRVALVTGASRGIGEAVARTFVEHGARVALVARGTAALESLVAKIGPASAHAFPLDVTDRAALVGLPRRVVDHFGRLDVVVNNAGVNHRGDFRERTPDELVAILDANLVAPVLLTHACLPLLRDDGVVVNVASLAGKVPVPHEAAYSGSKFGVRAFARALDLELADAGSKVRVVTVCPGPVDTGFLGTDLSLVPDLVFSQPMSTAQGIADAVLRVTLGDEQEVDVPALSGRLATLGYLSPRVYAALRPILRKVGARNKRWHIVGKGG